MKNNEVNNNEVKMYYSTFLITLAHNFGIAVDNSISIPLLFKVPGEEINVSYTGPKSKRVLGLTVVYKNKLYEFPMYVKCLPYSLGILGYKLNHTTEYLEEERKKHEENAMLEIDVFESKLLKTKEEILSFKDDSSEFFNVISRDVVSERVPVFPLELPMYTKFENKYIIITHRNNIYYVAFPFDTELSLDEVNKISTQVFDKLLRAKLRLKLLDDFIFNMLSKEYNLDSNIDPEEINNFILDISVVPNLENLKLDKIRKVMNKKNKK